MKKKPLNTGQKFPFMNRFLSGLVIALALALTAFEWTTVTYDYTIDPNDYTEYDTEEILPPITYRTEELEIPKPKEIPPTDFIEIIENTPDAIDPVEVIPTVVKPPILIIEPIDPPEVMGYEDDFPYTSVQVFAHYDNCKGLVNDELKACGMLSIRNEIQKRFKVTPQLKDIGGRQGVLMEIIIDENGEVEEIKTLQKTTVAMEQATKQAIQQLPKMNPAQQQGRNVRLRIEVPVVLSLK